MSRKQSASPLTRAKLLRAMVVERRVSADEKLEDEGAWEEWSEFYSYHGAELLALSLAALGRIEPEQPGELQFSGELTSDKLLHALDLCEQHDHNAKLVDVEAWTNFFVAFGTQVVRLALGHQGRRGPYNRNELGDVQRKVVNALAKCPMTVRQLIAATAAHERNLRRTLDVLTSRGILKQTGGGWPGSASEPRLWSLAVNESPAPPASVEPEPEAPIVATVHEPDAPPPSAVVTASVETRTPFRRRGRPLKEKAPTRTVPPPPAWMVKPLKPPEHQ